jgi:hypothetical protein
MSLQLAVAQIQRPSFWGQYETVGQSRQRFADRAKIGEEKREAVRNELRVLTKPIDATGLSERTGFSIQSIRHCMLKLCERGEARRVPRMDGLCYWELVK